MKKIYFFSLLLGIFQSVQGQAPGGVSSQLTLWLKSGTGTSTTAPGDALTSWNYANNANSFTATGAGPTFSTNMINFQPAVTFTNTGSAGQLMDGPTGVNAPITAANPNYAMFAVWRSNQVGLFQRVWLQADVSAASSGFSLCTWNDTRCGNEIETSPYDYSLTTYFSPSTWNITQINILNQATSDQEIVTDSNYSTGPKVTNTDYFGVNGPANRSIGNTLNELGAKGSANAQYLAGDIAEVIVFNRPINLGGEREKVFSYLSLKYGIPIKGNLVSSAGTTIWDATANATYNNSVFGLGEDDPSTLLVTRSNSYVTGSGTGAGQSGKGNIILSNPSALTTGGFLIIGNDNGGFTQAPAVKAGAQQFAQRWKVAQSGTVGNVDLDLDLTGITSTAVPGTLSSIQIQIDQDGDGDFTTGSQLYFNPTTFAGSIAHFSGISLTNGAVFTFITSNTTILPVVWRSFSGNFVGNTNDISLNWQVENNRDAQSYIVQHATDGSNYTNIATISNDPLVSSYNYLYSSAAPGNHYFRILEIDQSGKYIYSKVVVLSAKGGTSVTTTARILNSLAVNNTCQVEITSSDAVNAHIELWSVGGSRLAVIEQTVTGGAATQIPVSLSQYPSGSYLLKIQAGNLVRTEKVLKP